MIGAIQQKLLGSPARKTAMAGYLNLIVMTGVAVLSLREALHHLTDAQCGVWNALSQSLGLFLLLDFGVSAASARMIAGPLQEKDRGEIDSWWTVTVVVMAIQGLVLLGAGLAAKNLLLTHFYKIPADLLADSGALWTVMVAGAAIKIPFQAYASILFCQNRFYHMHLGSALSGIVNFVIFVVLLKMGYGLKAYMPAFFVSILAMALYWVWTVRRSRVELHFSLATFRREKLKVLFSYSNDIFIAGFSTQISNVVQTVIISNLFGVAALNPFNVSTRSSGIVGQVMSRTSEAKVPRWWNFFLDRKLPEIAAEVRTLALWFVPLVFFSAAGIMVFNRTFITLVFNRPDVYEGHLFDLSVAVLLIVQQWLKAFQFVFPMSRRTRGWAVISVIDALLTVGLGRLFAIYWGAPGLLFGSALGSLLSSVPFTVRIAPGLLHVPWREYFGRVLPDLAVGSLALGGIWVLLGANRASGWFPSAAEWYGSLVLLALGGWLGMRLVKAGVVRLPSR